MKKLVKVLVIDDSALVRQTLSSIIEKDPDLHVIGAAADPFFAAEKIKHEIPDVITLDVEMPRMDGITFLKTLMRRYPIPVVIISSLTQQSSHLAIKALELGAVDVIEKSEIKATKVHLEESTTRIVDAIKAAALVNLRQRMSLKVQTTMPPVVKESLEYATTDKVIALGASTGGTEAIRYLLKQAMPTTSGIVITQHMPAGFTKSFAQHLNQECQIHVKEATHGDRIMRGHAYIAPGGRHMEVVKSGAKYYIKISDGPLVNRHRPSVDVLFNSVAEHAGSNALGVIMTGMGKDGAQGLLNMKQRGARTIAQDEASSVVFGMPKEAIRINAADQVLSLSELPAKLSAVI